MKYVQNSDIGRATFSAYGSHRRWWTALPALPPSREALDWWAIADGRASRYRRLARVWQDYTLFVAPKTDADRRHFFSNPKSGPHACVAIWENFALFHPKDFVPALLRKAGLAESGPVVDACWSYEYQEPSLRKTADIVLHARTEVGDDFILVVEAKFSKTDRLKENPKSGLPDTNPAGYRDAVSLLDIPRREAVYLVRDSYIPTVRAKVVPDEQGYGLLSWTDLIQLQIELCQTCILPSAANLVQSGLYFVGERLGILKPKSSEKPFSPLLFRQSAEQPDLPVYLREWLAAAAFFIESVTSGEVPVEPPFEYLRNELTFPQLHTQHPKQQDVHSTQLWRLPRRL